MLFVLTAVLFGCLLADLLADLLALMAGVLPLVEVLFALMARLPGFLFPLPLAERLPGLPLSLLLVEVLPALLFPLSLAGGLPGLPLSLSLVEGLPALLFPLSLVEGVLFLLPLECLGLARQSEWFQKANGGGASWRLPFFGMRLLLFGLAVAVGCSGVG